MTEEDNSTNNKTTNENLDEEEQREEEEEDEEDVLTPEELVMAASSAFEIEKQRLEETSRSTSLSESTSSFASKEFVPPPDWPTRDRRMEQKPGAFRAGSGAMTRADEETAGGGEDQSLATTMNPVDGEQEAANNNIIHATLVTEVEAPSPPSPVARDSSAEIYKAELLRSNVSAEEDIKTSKRRWLWLSLIACAMMVTAVSVAVPITLSLDEKNEAESQEGFNEDDDPSSGSGDEPEFLLPGDLLGFDRITHHVAFFDWGAPSRCSLSMDNPLESVEEPLFVRINCGTGNTSEEGGAALVFWPELSEGSDCVPHRWDGMECNRSSYAGMARVAFTCGTHSAHYDTTTNANSGAGNITAYISIQQTKVQCDSGNSTVMDDEDEENSVRIALTVGRICFSPPEEPRLQFPEECAGSNSESDELTEFSLPDGGVACIQQSDPCTAAEGLSSCAFHFDSFSAADSSNDPECQSASLGIREGQFVQFLENFPADVLEIFN